MAVLICVLLLSLAMVCFAGGELIANNQNAVRSREIYKSALRRSDGVLQYRKNLLRQMSDNMDAQSDILKELLQNPKYQNIHSYFKSKCDNAWLTFEKVSFADMVESNKAFGSFYSEEDMKAMLWSINESELS